MNQVMFKCHVLLYPIFEFLLDVTKIDYTVITDTSTGIEVSDNDAVYPGGYIEYSVSEEDEYRTAIILPYQPYEQLQIQQLLTPPPHNVQPWETLQDELCKYKDFRPTRIEVHGLIAKYFYRDVRGKEKCVDMNYEKVMRLLQGNYPIRVKK